MVRDPVTGETVSYAEMSIRLQQRRKQRQLEEARAKNPEGVLVRARNTENTGAPMKRGVGQTHWQRYEKGGDVNHPGQPVGTDTVPAWLTPGEFVVNAEAVRMYGPQIEAMNNHGRALQRAQGGTIPQHYDIGGKVKKIYEEGYTAPGQAYAIAKSMGYAQGGLVNFLKKHEGYRDKAYQDSAGVWTIGYGRTRNSDGSKIKPGQTTSREAEDSWIIDRAASERSAIDAYAEKHGYDWTDNQKDALASFRYNGGQGMLDMLTDGGKRDTATIESKFGLYNKVTDPKTGKKVAIDGLTNRRNAELELWGGQGNQVPGNQETQVVPPDEPIPAPQPVPQGEVVDVSPSAEAADQVSLGDSGGFPIGQLVNQLGQQSFSPAPSIGLQGVNPEFIPSVTSREPDNPQNRNQFYNQGGPVYMANGGWLDFLWGSEEDKAKTAQALRRRPGIRTADPLAGSIIDTRGPQQPLQPSQFGADQVPPSGAYPTDSSIPRFDQQAGVIQGQIGAAQAPAAGSVPIIEDTPPVPGSDEALLQGSSQQVERNEQLSAKQQWDRLKAQRDALPAGPERVALSNQMNQLNVADPALDPRVGLGSGAANAAGIPEPEKVYSGRGEGYETDDTEQYLTNEALRTAQLQAAVTAPDAPGAEFIQSRVNALTDQADSLGIPPEAQGVGANVGVASDPVVGIAPQGLQPPEEVGAVPGIDSSEPKEVKPSSKLDGKDGEIKRHAAAATKVEEIISNEEVPEEIASMSTDDATKRAQELATRQPGIQDFAQNTLKQAFGDLFKPQELGRMAIMFLGAMATGASAGQALAFAGTQYLNRVDAAQGKYERAAISGKYTKESLKAYKESGDPIDLVAKGATPEALGNFKEFYKDGKRYRAQEYDVGGNKVWITPNGEQINATYHTDPSRTPGTQEFKEATTALTRDLENDISELQDRFHKDEDGNYRTNIVPGIAAKNAAKWAQKNGIPPEAMGQLTRNALEAAALDGKKATNIEPYLNDQYVQSQVGDPTLFKDSEGKTASAEKVNLLMNQFASKLQDLPAYQGLSSTAISSRIMQAARPKWAALDADIRKSYNRRAGPGESGFMVYLRDQLE